MWFTEFALWLKGEADKNSLNVERMFDTFAERYDKLYEKPFGKLFVNALIKHECRIVNQLILFFQSHS